MEIKDIIELMKAVSDNGLTKFELENGDTKLVMKREQKIVTVSGAGIPTVGMPVQMAAGTENFVMPQMMEQNEKSSAAEMNEGTYMITCPLVGTFYSSPSPDAESFVKVGDHVKKGQVVGIVEAMKLMNEIESEFDGIVEEILVDNESVVEYGQPLFRIR